MTDRGLYDHVDRDAFFMITGERLDRVRRAVIDLYSEKNSEPDAQRDMAQRLEWVFFDAVKMTGIQGTVGEFEYGE